MAGPPIKHAATLAAEGAAEAERKARNPRAVLRQAHQLAAEALGEVNRLHPIVARAAELARSLEIRQREAAAAGDEAAQTALMSALAAGAAPPAPLDVDRAEALGRELRTAKGALAELERQATAAADRLARCRAGVQRCAVDVLADRAAEAAIEILDAAAELDRRRADLASLAGLLTAESRRLNGQARQLSGQVNRALHPPDRQLFGGARPSASTNWSAEYRSLCEARAEHPG